jgi:hypothetical protein
LNFDDHLSSVMQTRSIDLSERGGGNGIVFQIAEDAFGLSAKLIFEDPRDFRPRDDLAVVLKARQGVQIGRGEDVRPRR